MPTTPIFFSPAEQDAIRSACSAVWDECAYDILQATAEEKGKSDPRRHRVA